jgi:hypothetical protein
LASHYQLAEQDSKGFIFIIKQMNKIVKCKLIKPVLNCVVSHPKQSSRVDYSEHRNTMHGMEREGHATSHGLKKTIVIGLLAALTPRHEQIRNWHTHRSAR